MDIDDFWEGITITYIDNNLCRLLKKDNQYFLVPYEYHLYREESLKHVIGPFETEESAMVFLEITE